MKLTKFVPTLEELTGHRVHRFELPDEVAEAIDESETTGEWRGVSGLPTKADAKHLQNQTRRRLYQDRYDLRMRTRILARPSGEFALILKIEPRD